jgi:hypothetical protein
LQLFSAQLRQIQEYPGDITARLRKSPDEPRRNRITFKVHRNHWDGAVYRFGGCDSCRTSREDDINAKPGKLGRMLGQQPFAMPLVNDKVRPSV